MRAYVLSRHAHVATAPRRDTWALRRADAWWRELAQLAEPRVIDWRHTRTVADQLYDSPHRAATKRVRATGYFNCTAANDFKANDS